jgi:hypothetical protein
MANKPYLISSSQQIFTFSGHARPPADGQFEKLFRDDGIWEFECMLFASVLAARPHNTISGGGNAKPTDNQLRKLAYGMMCMLLVGSNQFTSRDFSTTSPLIFLHVSP